MYIVDITWYNYNGLILNQQTSCLGAPPCNYFSCLPDYWPHFRLPKLELVTIYDHFRNMERNYWRCLHFFGLWLRENFQGMSPQHMALYMVGTSNKSVSEMAIEYLMTQWLNGIGWPRWHSGDETWRWRNPFFLMAKASTLLSCCWLGFRLSKGTLIIHHPKTVHG